MEAGLLPRGFAALKGRRHAKAKTMRIKTKEDRRDRIKSRLRKRIAGTPERPRLSVFRSMAHVYVQVIDDRSGTTIAPDSPTAPRWMCAPTDGSVMFCTSSR